MGLNSYKCKELNSKGIKIAITYRFSATAILHSTKALEPVIQSAVKTKFKIRNRRNATLSVCNGFVHTAYPWFFRLSPIFSQIP